MASLKAFSAYDLPSVEVLVRYLHTAAGFPIFSNWLAAIKSNNYSSRTSFTYQNTSKYQPASTKTLRGHTNQTR